MLLSTQPIRVRRAEQTGQATFSHEDDSFVKLSQLEAAARGLKHPNTNSIPLVTMRYEDWDILLFPKDCKVPLKEFKVSCHVVQDAESRQLGSPFGLPTLCCFVPSLPHGSPFQVSIHSWTAPVVSQFAQSFSQYPENIKFEARLFIDGRLMASTILGRKSAWPHIIAQAWAVSATAELEPLKFPSFREELLRQNWWVPADDLGRIKVVLSEGFPRDSPTNPFERIKNIIAFSFQHAPQEILEQSAIAWPNPSMWCSAPYPEHMQVPTLHCDDSDAHAHSPRRQSSTNGQPMNHSGNWTNPKLLIGNRRATHPNCGTGAYPGFRNADWYGSAAYQDYWAAMGLGMAGNLMRNGVMPRHDRMTSSDISMPDYVPLGSSGQLTDEAPAGNVAQDGDKQAVSLKVPTNTPTAVDMMGREREGVGFPMITHNTSLPSDFADSLTNSLLNQPMPMHFQHPASCPAPAADVKSRKENRGQVLHAMPPSATGHPATTTYYEHQEMRRVSQQMIVPSGSSLPIGIVDAGKAGLDGTNQICAARKCATEGEDEKTVTRAVSDKGVKRNRNFTPASSRVIDEEDEPRRASPRVRLTPFVEDDATRSVG
ncbi:hypothetical protein E4U42_003273 [Claviceps africana]|uniref:Uncharacterized protein n=1 Tax=Claviceps africana TaxID=83212 RepID=A0A8K0NJ51_9HYPO|nr:hypothetical protein E4U42_003273 [Claviceps africana]